MLWLIHDYAIQCLQWCVHIPLESSGAQYICYVFWHISTLKWVFSWGVIPSKGVTGLTSVSPVEVTSVVVSGLSIGAKVSFHSGSFIDEGASREESSSMTSVCLGLVSFKYSSFGGGTDNSWCWSFTWLCSRVFGMGA